MNISKEEALLIWASYGQLDVLLMNGSTTLSEENRRIAERLWEFIVEQPPE